jgi:hypothetical protein
LALSSCLCCLALAAEEPPGYVEFGKFNPPADGGQFVEVQINQNLIAMAARLVENSEPEIAKMLQDLHSLRVNVIALQEDNRADITKRVQAIRSTLKEQDWERVATVREKDQDVNVFVKMRGDQAVQGLAVTVVEGDKQAVLVNVVGDIKPEKLSLIGERFDIEPLKKLGPVLGQK